MKSRITLAIALVALPALSAPAVAQSYADQRRWDAARARYQTETNLYERERDRYFAMRDRNRGPGAYGNGAPRPYDGRDGQYGNATPPPPPGFDEDRYVTTYDASRDYRDDPRYQERRLSANDQVYRGSDGRYYCKRNDGTTGLIAGAAGGGILGNVLDGGRHRTAGTLIGGALGALAGRAIDQNSDVRCR